MPSAGADSAASPRRRPCRTSSADLSTSTFSGPWQGDGSRDEPGHRRQAGGGGAIEARAERLRGPRVEEVSRAATVLLVDMSRSMLLRGCFMAAKKVAIALDTLIRTRYPRDELHVIGFAYHAREIRPGTLASLSWHGYEYGTNLQHGLMLGRSLLADRTPPTARSWSSPTGSRPRISRTAVSSSAIRRRAAPSRKRSRRSGAARVTGSPSTRSCSSARPPWPSSWNV